MPAMINYVGGPFDGEALVVEDVVHEQGYSFVAYKPIDPNQPSGTYTYQSSNPPPFLDINGQPILDGQGQPITAQYNFAYVP